MIDCDRRQLGNPPPTLPNERRLAAHKVGLSVSRSKHHTKKARGAVVTLLVVDLDQHLAA
jgi:hypothetical protein